MTAARDLLDARVGRGALKRLAESLDADPELRAAVLVAARERGIALPDEAVDWPGKRLLRAARGREDASRIRTNPVARDEGFTCAVCAAEIAPHGRTARDHCPRCLRSVHVDEVPGDRAAGCGGILEPVGVVVASGRTMLRYRCARCGAARTNQAIVDGDDPDDWALVVALSARGGEM